MTLVDLAGRDLARKILTDALNETLDSRIITPADVIEEQLQLAAIGALDEHFGITNIPNPISDSRTIQWYRPLREEPKEPA